MTTLGLALGLSPDELWAVARKTNELYKPGPPRVKPDGSTRETLCPKYQLRVVQQRIRDQIFRNLEFPVYVTGSVKGGDQKKNASIHAGGKFLLTEDIKGFFPAITIAHITRIFSEFFGFSDEVSACLALLTTKDGLLPQGSLTAPTLANLAFWEREHLLVAKLQARGFRYTRFVDDVSVSALRPVDAEEKTWLVTQVYGLLASAGCRPNRKKHQITTSRERMVATKLNVNTKPGLPREERSRIRAAVHEQERIAKKPNPGSDSLAPTLARAKGRVERLKRFHPGKASVLKGRLAALAE